jgi:probable addiction module antidote protein
MTTKKKSEQRTSDYKEFLFKRLRDPKFAAGYLTAALEEGADTFLIALKDVAEAKGGIAPLARKSRLNREGLYEMLSERGNPRFSSLSTIIDALGMKLELTPKVAKLGNC